MKKSELVDQVAKGAGVAKRQAEKVLDAFFETAKKAAKKGDEVSWPKFGVVEAAKKAGKKAGKTASSKKGAAKNAVTKVVERVEKVVHLPGSHAEQPAAGGEPADDEPAAPAAEATTAASEPRTLVAVPDEVGTPEDGPIPAPAVPGTAAAPARKAPTARKALANKLAGREDAHGREGGARKEGAGRSKGPGPEGRDPVSQRARAARGRGRAAGSGSSPADGRGHAPDGRCPRRTPCRHRRLGHPGSRRRSHHRLTPD